MLTCNGDESPPKYHVGVSYGVFGSTLTFGSVEGDVLRRAAIATFEWRKSDTMTFQVGAGAALPGALTVGDERIRIDPGFLVSVASSWRLVDGAGSKPFVLLALTGAASFASTARTNGERAPFIAIDVRAGLTVGKTFFDVLSPYAAARVFGGPVFWRISGDALTGTDTHHYQIGAGMVVALPKYWDVFAEGAPLGERAVSVGGGRAF